MPVMRKWKLLWWSGSKNSQQHFSRLEYMLLFEGGKLLLRETVTMLRSRDVIHRGPAWFSCIIHVPASVIILVLKKKALIFDLSSYIFILIDVSVFLFINVCINISNNARGCPRGVMVKALDCGIVVREFVPQSRYYVHFRANTLGKGMNPLILPAMG